MILTKATLWSFDKITVIQRNSKHGWSEPKRVNLRYKEDNYNSPVYMALAHACLPTRLSITIKTATFLWDPVGSTGTRQRRLEPFLQGMPCLESSDITLSIEGGLRPKGNGSHGLLIASFTTLSTTSSACKHFKYVCHFSALKSTQSFLSFKVANVIFISQRNIKERTALLDDAQRNFAACQIYNPLL